MIQKGCKYKYDNVTLNNMEILCIVPFSFTEQITTSIINAFTTFILFGLLASTCSKPTILYLIFRPMNSLSFRVYHISSTHRVVYKT